MLEQDLRILMQEEGYDGKSLVPGIGNASTALLMGEIPMLW
ncbi:MAG: hypothetical protein N2487_01130 [Verrucomicrobiae bacterium]|nr:hypothetical protein [Verrucomicrobiae bacterium]